MKLTATRVLAMLTTLFAAATAFSTTTAMNQFNHELEVWDDYQRSVRLPMKEGDVPYSMIVYGQDTKAVDVGIAILDSRVTIGSPAAKLTAAVPGLDDSVANDTDEYSPAIRQAMQKGGVLRLRVKLDCWSGEATLTGAEVAPNLHADAAVREATQFKSPIDGPFPLGTIATLCATR